MLCPVRLSEIHKYKYEYKGKCSESESLQTPKYQQNEPTTIPTIKTRQK